MSKRKALNRMLLDAVLAKHLPNVIALLDQGADIEARDREHRETPLMLALNARSLPIVTELIRRGADVNAKDYQGMTALMYAVRAASIDLIQLLLANGADCGSVDVNGDTALTCAVSTADIDIVHLILAENSCWNSESVQQAKAQAQSWGLTAIAETLEAVEASPPSEKPTPTLPRRKGVKSPFTPREGVRG